MAEKKTPSEHQKAVIERRRSNAASTHGKTKHTPKDRMNARRKWREDQEK